MNDDNLCPGAVQNEELGGAAELQGVGHHPGPLRGRVLLLVRQGPDDAGAGVRVAGHVERPRHHRRHLQQPQWSVVTSQPSTTRIYPVTNVISPMQAPTTTSRALLSTLDPHIFLRSRNPVRVL